MTRLHVCCFNKDGRAASSKFLHTLLPRTAEPGSPFDSIRCRSLRAPVKIQFHTLQAVKAQKSLNTPVAGLPIKNEKLFSRMEVQQCVCGQSINQTTGRQVGSGWASVRRQGHSRNADRRLNTPREQSNLNINTLPLAVTC